MNQLARDMNRHGETCPACEPNSLGHIPRAHAVRQLVGTGVDNGALGISPASQISIGRSQMAHGADAKVLPRVRQGSDKV